MNKLASIATLMALTGMMTDDPEPTPPPAPSLDYGGIVDIVEKALIAAVNRGDKSIVRLFKNGLLELPDAQADALRKALEQAGPYAIVTSGPMGGLIVLTAQDEDGQKRALSHADILKAQADFKKKVEQSLGQARIVKTTKRDRSRAKAARKARRKNRAK